MDLLCENAGGINVETFSVNVHITVGQLGGPGPRSVGALVALSRVWCDFKGHGLEVFNKGWENLNEKE